LINFLLVDRFIGVGMKKLIILLIICITITSLFSQDFTVGIFADQRLYACDIDPIYTVGAIEAMASMDTFDLILIPGDMDPVYCSDTLIDDYFGRRMPRYFVAGNHDLPNGGTESYPGENMDFLRALNDGEENTLQHIVNFGPPNGYETTYSFDYENCHFIVLNQYYTGESDEDGFGDISDPLYEWLIEDLDANELEYVFVVGHEPAYPQPDADNGRLRHVGDSLDQFPENRDRFWDLLVQYEVLAYICGHTHNYSAILLDGVWQFDVGHARGYGDPGAPSTFCIINVSGDYISLNTYREAEPENPLDPEEILDYTDFIHSYNLHGVPPPPTNIEFEYVSFGTYALIEWDYVPGAFYWIYSADIPTDEFFNITEQGIFEIVGDKMTWTKPAHSAQKYFYVTRHD
jgi:hypothetical protein